MGRELGKAEVQRISGITHLSLALFGIGDSTMPPDFLKMRAILTENEAVAIQPLNEQSIAGYRLLQDIAGRPGYLLRVDLPRGFFQQGESTLREFTLSLLGTGLVLCLTTLLLLNRLRTEKIGLQLDDFGTGYSSLSYLRRLPFDGLKIDKSFVQEAGLRHQNAEIVATITLLARTLGMKALAEGVETLAQLQMLIRSGCDHAQGNLFSAAVDAETSRSFFAGFDHILLQLEQEKAEPVAAAV